MKKTASNTFKRIGCFVEGYNFIDCTEAAALRNFKQCAERKGHEFDFIFKKDIAKIPEYDSLFIRAVTDPTYTACIVSKIANENGLKVVDDPRSIQICSNKVHMYWRTRISRRALPAHNIVFQGRIKSRGSSKTLREIRQSSRNKSALYQFFENTSKKLRMRKNL